MAKFLEFEKQDRGAEDCGDEYGEIWGSQMG
jgi:hypothetical protein